MNVREKLLSGLVIPAHPLALTAQRKLDERRQRALTRYYLAAGAGGIAVGVHTTQFEIRNPQFSLLRPVLELASHETHGHDIVKIAGVCGKQEQAQKEAELAAALGYDAALLSLADLRNEPIPVLLDHARSVSSTIPIIGFYLQPSVGGYVLPYEFWRELAEIENLVAIKIAPFNRYQTLDVLRAVADSGRAKDIALYTGNDDHILLDLMTEFDFGGAGVRFAGGLLGQWAVWTKAAVCHLERIKRNNQSELNGLLTLAQQLTDANAAIFDPGNKFRGCIPGIHEILRRQGLLQGRWCLDPNEELSLGQSEEIDRVCQAYPQLQDNAFVREHLDEWLA
ncbi:MAG TPA: dihydrodipicolinate synthase family protein [Terriglobales bacterium]|jgi:dihydrodipicolinate synthase/N-acetylneuraminate lyase|nr:dihydrodipicolinate synthase family protein [Terriglobales bacterium]